MSVHDERCESEFLNPPGAYTPCGCDQREMDGSTPARPLPAECMNCVIGDCLHHGFGGTDRGDTGDDDA